MIIHVRNRNNLKSRLKKTARNGSELCKQVTYFQSEYEESIEVAKEALELIDKVFSEAFLEREAGEFIAMNDYPEIGIVRGEVVYSTGGHLTPSISDDIMYREAFYTLNLSKPGEEKPKRLRIMRSHCSREALEFAHVYAETHSVRETVAELKRRFNVVINDRTVRGWRRMQPRKRELS